MSRKRKSLLKKHQVESAERRRTCSHSGKSISKGEPCVVVWDSSFDRHTYSREIALQMVSDARQALVALEAELSKAAGPVT